MGTRVFRHGELPLVVLALLDERPMHAYELLGRISTLFTAYTASPGSVYPAVSALEEQGLVRGRDEGRRTTYEVTDAGRAALAARRQMLDEVEQRLGVTVTERPLDKVLATLAERARALEPVAGADAVRAVVEQAIEQLDRLAAPKRRRARTGG